MATPKIYDDIVKLRGLVGGLVARKGAAPYPTKSAKELVIKLREHGDSLGMIMINSVIKTESRTDFVGIVKNKKGNDVVGCLVSCKVVIRYMSSDGSYLDFEGSGQGFDDLDKALGKAETYAYKSAACKGLCLPDEEMVDTDDSHEPTTPVAVASKASKSEADEWL